MALVFLDPDEEMKKMMRARHVGFVLYKCSCGCRFVDSFDTRRDVPTQYYCNHGDLRNRLIMEHEIVEF